MQRATIGISLTLVLSAGLVGALLTPALADGDPYYSNGINPSGVRTPVPAPIPYPVEEADWYFRGDFAAGFGASPSVTELGVDLINALFVGSTTRSDSFEPSFTGGVGVGYIWGPHLRTDLTVDIHSIMTTENSGNAVYFDGALQETSISDKTKFISTILLANAYYDIRTGTPWTPYIGGGLGFAVNQLTRNFSWSDTGQFSGTLQESGRSTDVQFAAAAMAGVAYDFSSFFAIDVNYRFLHIGGSEVSLNIPGIDSTTEIGSLNEHQIRAGFRFYVN